MSQFRETPTLVFDPESESLTLSIGAKLTMKFSNNSGSKTEEVPMEDGSVLVTSRRAQDFWMYNVEQNAAAKLQVSVIP